mmetsp:Transcript_17227/g.54387  ORF Transcript_17227/g.54387 Transcript_17227/m.54387 type:complete len:652 (-) Transcript_17227:36-1991(-)
MVRAPSASPEVNVAGTSFGGTGGLPKDDITSKHKVISFGTVFRTESEQENRLYNYVHQRVDLTVSKGSIPVGFLSTITTDDGHPIYLATRDGGLNERDLPVGPEYQVSWRADREVIGGNTSDGWNNSLDELWTAVLSHFEARRLLCGATLEKLDADPFVLFGIDDPITQQALAKLEQFPALMCSSSTPSFDEWSAYLRIEPTDNEMKWLVQAFSETELPKPWTCYKGVGSIVCYIRSDTGAVTWKHPFYDYFRQLRDFCQQASQDEVKQVRCNRLLWSYEATRVLTQHDQEPLVSPEYVGKMCDIFGYDIKTQGYLVRNLKAQLKVFARSYREKQDIDLHDVVNCAELLQQDVEKHREMKDHWESKVNDQVQFDLMQLANGKLHCVNCGTVALSFCLECKDYLCLNCYDLLHNKGARLLHSPFRLVSCTLCVIMPAKLHCTFTDKSLCHSCYAMKHIKMLPPNGKENQPRRIDYVQQYSLYAQQAQERAVTMLPGMAMEAIADDANDSVLSTDWHPFYDVRGVKYYYNFATGERMRQSPQRVPNTADPGAEELGADPELATVTGSPPGSTLGSIAGSTRFRGQPRNATGFGGLSGRVSSPGLMAATAPLAMTGTDALTTEPAARDPAATQPDLRLLRPPHRVHKPHELPAS